MLGSQGEGSDEYEMAGRPSESIEGGCLGACGGWFVDLPIMLFRSEGVGRRGGKSHTWNYGQGTNERQRRRRDD